MKTVVLDGYCLNPGDLNWEGFRRFGEVEVFDRTAPEEAALRLAGARAALTNKTRLTAEIFAQAPELAYVGVLATGYDVVDVAAARERGVVVTNVPAYSTDSVAQLVFALLLELCHNVKLHSDAVRAGEWAACADFSFQKSPLIELAGKTMGVVGFGRIGRAVARLADAFGMRVLAASRTQKDAPAYPGFAWAALEELLAEADVVSLHAPLTPETRGLINRRTLGLMKPTAFLINTARGPVVEAADLAEALAGGRIAAAAMDVLSTEPPSADNPLLSAPNCLVTPHIAWATREARRRLMAIAEDNLSAWASGAPRNVIS